MNSADILEVLVGCGLVLGFLISRVIKIVRSEDWKESKAPTRKKQTPKADTYTPPGASAVKPGPPSAARRPTMSILPWAA